MRLVIVMMIVSCICFACPKTNTSGEDATAGYPQSVGIDKAQQVKEIKELEEMLRTQTSNKIDKPIALELIEKSERFAEAYPHDSQTPALLFRTADLARGIGNYGLAIKHWGTVYNNYPDYNKAPDAHFLIGFTYENYLNDKEQAKRYYYNFLEKYPDHPLTEQVKQLLAVIDKTPEELVKEFEKQKD